MSDCGEPSVAIGTHSQGLPRPGAVPNWTKHLLAAQNEFDRPSDHPGGQDAEHLRP